MTKLSLKDKESKKKEKAIPPAVELRADVQRILQEVREHGDRALREFTARWDGVERASPRVGPEELEAARRAVPEAVRRDLKAAADHIRSFARRQLASLKEFDMEILPGVHVGQRLIPVDSAAVYVPGGRYPLPSTALMGIIPARVAGVGRVVACSPPGAATGGIHPVTLVAMELAGADENYCMGGAQAVAALAFGTETVAPVDMIVGPGNRYVTEAKRQVYGRVAIDFLAGPSEVLVIADDSADAALVAADLLAQCEHDPDATATLVSTSRSLAEAVLREVEEQLARLATAPVARASWEANGQVWVVSDLSEAVEVANQAAPEHLELHVREPASLVPSLRHYGSLFVGGLAAEVFGDYVSGTNHILPTMGGARYTGGLGVGTFLKAVTHQRLTEEGARALAEVAGRLADLEGLAAHAAAARLRLNAAGRSGTTDPEEIVQAHVWVSGRVQGVFFRASTREEAMRRGVVGWVRNLPDGRVEAVFRGRREAVDACLAWCREGPPGARVDRLEVKWESPGQAAGQARAQAAGQALSTFSVR